MPKKNLYSIQLILKSLQIMVAAGLILLPLDAYAIQLHTSSEGIITHQIGHLFFLFSMVVLIFTISKKGLASQKGWRLIQYSAFLFILWNISVITAHFLDNQIHVVTMENISLGQTRVTALNGSAFLAWFYYILKLDHLFCVPAMVFFFQGLSNLVDEQRQMTAKKEGP
jgi:phosphoribosylaminoimidazole-succinocarboxamide synthase